MEQQKIEMGKPQILNQNSHLQVKRQNNILNEQSQKSIVRTQRSLHHISSSNIQNNKQKLISPGQYVVSYNFQNEMESKFRTHNLLVGFKQTMQQKVNPKNKLTKIKQRPSYQNFKDITNATNLTSTKPHSFQTNFIYNKSLNKNYQESQNYSSTFHYKKLPSTVISGSNIIKKSNISLNGFNLNKCQKQNNFRKSLQKFNVKSNGLYSTLQNKGKHDYVNIKQAKSSYVKYEKSDCKINDFFSSSLNQENNKKNCKESSFEKITSRKEDNANDQSKKKNEESRGQLKMQNQNVSNQKTNDQEKIKRLQDRNRQQLSSNSNQNANKKLKNKNHNLGIKINQKEQNKSLRNQFGQFQMNDPSSPIYSFEQQNMQAKKVKKQSLTNITKRKLHPLIKRSPEFLTQVSYKNQNNVRGNFLKRDLDGDQNIQSQKKVNQKQFNDNFNEKENVQKNYKLKKYQNFTQKQNKQRNTNIASNINEQRQSQYHLDLNSKINTENNQKNKNKFQNKIPFEETARTKRSKNFQQNYKEFLRMKSEQNQKKRQQEDQIGQDNPLKTTRFKSIQEQNAHIERIISPLERSFMEDRRKKLSLQKQKAKIKSLQQSKNSIDNKDFITEDLQNIKNENKKSNINRKKTQTIVNQKSKTLKNMNRNFKINTFNQKNKELLNDSDSDSQVMDDGQNIENEMLRYQNKQREKKRKEQNKNNNKKNSNSNLNKDLNQKIQGIKIPEEVIKRNQKKQFYKKNPNTHANSVKKNLENSKQNIINSKNQIGRKNQNKISSSKLQKAKNLEQQNKLIKNQQNKKEQNRFNNKKKFLSSQKKEAKQKIFNKKQWKENIVQQKQKQKQKIVTAKDKQYKNKNWKWGQKEKANKSKDQKQIKQSKSVNKNKAKNVNEKNQKNKLKKDIQSQQDQNQYFQTERYQEDIKIEEQSTHLNKKSQGRQKIKSQVNKNLNNCQQTEYQEKQKKELQQQKQSPSVSEVTVNKQNQFIQTPSNHINNPTSNFNKNQIRQKRNKNSFDIQSDLNRTQNNVVEEQEQKSFLNKILNSSQMYEHGIFEVSSSKAIIQDERFLKIQEKQIKKVFGSNAHILDKIKQSNDLMIYQNYKRAPILQFIFQLPQEYKLEDLKFKSSNQKQVFLKNYTSSSITMEKTLPDQLKTFIKNNQILKALEIITNIDEWILMRIIQPFQTINQEVGVWIYCLGVWRIILISQQQLKEIVANCSNTLIFDKFSLKCLVWSIIQSAIKKACKQYYKEQVNHLELQQIVRMISGLRITKLKSCNKALKQLAYSHKKHLTIVGIPSLSTQLSKWINGYIFITRIQFTPKGEKVYQIKSFKKQDMKIKYYWIKEQKLLSTFSNFLIISKRFASYWTNRVLQIQNSQKGIFSINAQHTTCGSITIYCDKLNESNCQLCLYKQIQPQVLKLVGRLQSSKTITTSYNTNMYFDFSLKGTYYLFLQTSSKSNLSIESTSDKVKIQFIESVKKQTLRNQQCQYVQIDKMFANQKLKKWIQQQKKVKIKQIIDI